MQKCIFRQSQRNAPTRVSSTKAETTLEKGSAITVMFWPSLQPLNSWPRDTTALNWSVLPDCPILGEKNTGSAYKCWLAKCSWTLGTTPTMVYSLEDRENEQNNPSVSVQQFWDTIDRGPSERSLKPKQSSTGTGTNGWWCWKCSPVIWNLARRYGCALSNKVCGIELPFRELQTVLIAADDIKPTLNFVPLCRWAPEWKIESQSDEKIF